MALSKATFEQVLDDLSSRFIINVPDEELASVERICFQIEQAHWFYEDFIRVENPSLPSFTLKNFSAKYILPLSHCPLLHEWANEHETAFANFMEYKIRVPVCGAIILNEAMDKCILVKGWNARSGWGFPKGKINKDEPDITCAAREVWEETGFDVMPWIQEEHFVEQYMKDQRIRLYVIKGVPEDTVFAPQTRKEISKIEWHNVSDLPSSKAKPIERGAQSGKESGSEIPNPKHPSRYFMVIPFVHKLKGWIANQKKNAKRKGPQQNRQPAQHTQTSPGTTSRQDQTLSAVQIDTDALRRILGISDSPSVQHAEPHHSPLQQQQQPNNTDSQDPRPDLSKSSESLRELLGIGGMVEPSLNGERRSAHPAGGQPPSSSSSSSSAAPPAPPRLASSSSSDTLKTLLGIPLGLAAPASGSSPSPSTAHILNPAMAHPPPQQQHHQHHYPHPHHAGHDSPRFQPAQPSRMGYSPQLHHATAHMHHGSAPNSPHLIRAGAIPSASSPAHSTPGGGVRKNSVDLLALLNNGGAGGLPNGHSPQHPHSYQHQHPQQHPQLPFFPPPMMNGFMPGPNGHSYPMNGGSHSNHGSPVLARHEPRHYHPQLPPQHQQQQPPSSSFTSPKLAFGSAPNLPPSSAPAPTHSDNNGNGTVAKPNKQQQKQQKQPNGGNQTKSTMRDFKFNMDGIV
ncbi:mRNA-decapping enzyme subunit 2 [Actinomortierella ambigua]|uniref:mRNA-decapping enzyme subunit 2 n=1 Tax=Actinomortierella ambigua TaxID=1343610 RepID=A0A9P6U8V9_9FUNG|nr:mRNA-decapping enzyme subunit 2 [Actinomortierella ambigua]